MSLIAVDKVALENAAQWLEARGDPLQTASELRNMAKAPEAVELPLFEMLLRKFVLYTRCSCGTRESNKGTCGVCKTLATVEAERKKA